METVQLFCNALRTTPEIDKGASKTKINKAEKEHIKYITSLFDQLPYRVQHIARSELSKVLLYPQGKTQSNEDLLILFFE